MTYKGDHTRLESAIVSELEALIQGIPLGGSFEIPASADLCFSLELFVPEKLRADYPAWERESIDGFFVSKAIKTGSSSAELAGLCILIGDQTLTPFHFRFEISPDTSQIAGIHLKVGEPGGGPLGISGPACNSREARKMAASLVGRLNKVSWVYEVETTGSE
jgi:hypothetical protein